MIVYVHWAEYSPESIVIRDEVEDACRKNGFTFISVDIGVADPVMPEIQSVPALVIDYNDGYDPEVRKTWASVEDWLDKTL